MTFLIDFEPIFNKITPMKNIQPFKNITFSSGVQISPISSIDSDSDDDDLHKYDDYINRDNMLPKNSLITPKPTKRKRNSSDFNNLPLAKQKRMYEQFIKSNKGSDITFQEFKTIQNSKNEPNTWIKAKRKPTSTSLPKEKFPFKPLNIITQRPISPISQQLNKEDETMKKYDSIMTNLYHKFRNNNYSDQNCKEVRALLKQAKSDNYSHAKLDYLEDWMARMKNKKDVIEIPPTQHAEEIKFIHDITEEDFDEILNTSNANIGIQLNSPITSDKINILGDYVLKQLRDNKTENQGKGQKCGIQGQCFNLGHLLLTFDNVEKEFKNILFEQVKIIAERKFNSDEKRKVSITVSHEMGNSTEHQHPHVHIALTTWPNESNWHWHGHTFWDIEWIINGEVKYFHPNISYKDKRTAHIAHQYVMKEDLDPIIYNRYEGLQIQLDKLNDPKADKKNAKDVSYTSSTKFFSFYYLRVR